MESENVGWLALYVNDTDIEKFHINDDEKEFLHELNWALSRLKVFRTARAAEESIQKLQKLKNKYNNREKNVIDEVIKNVEFIKKLYEGEDDE